MVPAFMDDGRYCHAFAQEGADGFLELQRGPGRGDLNLGHLPKKIGWSMESPWFIMVDDDDDVDGDDDDDVDGGDADNDVDDDEWWWWWW